jgi:hypothetical protein
LESGRGVRVLAGTAACRRVGLQLALGRPSLRGEGRFVAWCGPRAEKGRRRRRSSPGSPSQQVGSPNFPWLPGRSCPVRVSVRPGPSGQPPSLSGSPGKTRLRLTCRTKRRPHLAGGPTGWATDRRVGASCRSAASPVGSCLPLPALASWRLPKANREVCRPSSYRPVLKHGPRSLTCARVVELRFENSKAQ